MKGIAPNVGDVFVLMGGRTGRDGIHGVTFASEELTTTSELESRPAVQIGDPFTKKQVMEATFEALERVNIQGLRILVVEDLPVVFQNWLQNVEMVQRLK